MIDFTYVIVDYFYSFESPESILCDGVKVEMCGISMNPLLVTYNFHTSAMLSMEQENITSAHFRPALVMQPSFLDIQGVLGSHEMLTCFLRDFAPPLFQYESKLSQFTCN